MNEKIEFRFWGIEVSDNYFCILILNWNIRQNVVVKPSGKAEYVEMYNKIHRYVVTEKHFLDKDINIDKIYEKGYSTKPHNTGLGLWEVENILKKHKNITRFTTKDNKLFKQQIEIYKS